MQHHSLYRIRVLYLHQWEGYKVFISVLFGLLGFIGSFYSIQFTYGDVKIIINWSLVLPLMIALAWGKRYGVISIILGLTVLYPFYSGRYNGWACLVASFSLFLWILIQGYGSEKRGQARKFYNNIYFLQFIYIIIRLVLYFTAFPFLYRFNPPFWYPDAHTTIDYGTITVFAFKSIIVEFILFAVGDVLLTLPLIRKIFRLYCPKASRYNTAIVLGLIPLGLLFVLIILTFNSYIIDGQHSFQWLLHPSPKALMTFLLTSLLCMILGGMMARIFQRQLETEEILRVSEDKYHSIFENINDLYTEVAMDGTILILSPSVREVLGYDAEELIETNIGNLYVSPGQRSEMIKTLLQEKKIKNYEIPIKDKYGGQRYIWLHAKITDYSDGQQKIIGVARDITKYKEAKTKREKSEKNYKLLFDKMMNGFVAFKPVFNENQKLQDIRFVDVNPAFEKYLSKKASEVLGKTWHEVYGVRNRNLEVYEKVFLTGLPQFYEAYNPNQNHQYYFANAFMINENRVGVIFDNITERVTAEEELKRVNANLEAIIENTTDHIWLIDKDFRYIFSNTANINHIKKHFGIDITPGMRSEDVLTKEYALAWNLYYERAVKDGSYSMELLTPESRKYLDISLIPIYEDGEVLAISCFAKDITQRKTAEQEILKLNMELEQRVMERTAELQTVVSELEAFTYTVSHDLKSPLRAIEGYNRIILEDYEKSMDADMAEMVGNVRNLCGDMITMINKLLQYSTTSKLAIYKEPVNTSDLFGMVFHDLQSSYPERIIELVVEEELPEVMADKVLLKLVIYNILSNAIKFTKAREKALIMVGCQINEEEHIFYIKDNGVGFDMEYSGKLFGIFQRLHSPKEYEGSGIGLATIRKIIEKHGGRTLIEGKVDEGAIVYFSLPIY